MRGVLNVYHGLIEATECQHKIKRRNPDTRIFEWISTWQKYRSEKYAGRIEKCSLCKMKRVLDTSEEAQAIGTIRYIEQASLF